MRNEFRAILFIIGPFVLITVGDASLPYCSIFSMHNEAFLGKASPFILFALSSGFHQYKFALSSVEVVMRNDYYPLVCFFSFALFSLH